MKLRIATGLLLILGACGDAPTGVPAAGPSGPSFTGYVIGSGNRADTTVAPTTTAPEVQPGDDETATNSESAAGGGYVIGSGN